MVRKIFHSFLILTLFLCTILIVSCGHELDADYEGDWAAVEDEIEYRMDGVDLKPVEEVEIEESEGWDDETDDGNDY